MIFPERIRNESNGLRKPHFPVEALKVLSKEVQRGSKHILVGPNGRFRLATFRVPPHIWKSRNQKGSLVEFNYRSQREEIKALTGVLPKATDLYDRILQGISIVLGTKKSTLSKFHMN